MISLWCWDNVWAIQFSPLWSCGSNKAELSHGKISDILSKTVSVDSLSRKYNLSSFSIKLRSPVMCGDLLVILPGALLIPRKPFWFYPFTLNDIFSSYISSRGHQLSSYSYSLNFKTGVSWGLLLKYLSLGQQSVFSQKVNS